MQRNNGVRYFYRANASAFGGQLLRPIPEIIEAQGATSLPISGGYASSRTGPFRHRELVSFESASTQASGSQSADGGTFDTLITSTVTKLDIGGMITADCVVARVSSEHPNQSNTIPRFTLMGSHFVNLRIAGCPVQMQMAQCLFDQDATVQKLRAEFPQQNGGTDERPVQCSLFKDIGCPEGIWKAQGNSIYLPQFGMIYLGEILATPSSRRLTMIRVELGCACEGDVSVSVAEGDGHRIP